MTRSTLTASAYMTASVSSRATKAGTPISCRPTSVSAANTTMMPWAKLNTPEALKISTKPSAISEYSMPVIRPPISVSRKKPMSVAPGVVRGQ